MVQKPLVPADLTQMREAGYSPAQQRAAGLNVGSPYGDKTFIQPVMIPVSERSGVASLQDTFEKKRDVYRGILGDPAAQREGAQADALFAIANFGLQLAGATGGRVGATFGEKLAQAAEGSKVLPTISGVAKNYRDANQKFDLAALQSAEGERTAAQKAEADRRKATLKAQADAEAAKRLAGAKVKAARLKADATELATEEERAFERKKFRVELEKSGESFNSVNENGDMIRMNERFAMDDNWKVTRTLEPFKGENDLPVVVGRATNEYINVVNDKTGNTETYFRPVGAGLEKGQWKLLTVGDKPATSSIAKIELEEVLGVSKDGVRGKFVIERNSVTGVELSRDFVPDSISTSRVVTETRMATEDIVDNDGKLLVRKGDAFEATDQMLLDNNVYAGKYVPYKVAPDELVKAMAIQSNPGPAVLAILNAQIRIPSGPAGPDGVPTGPVEAQPFYKAWGAGLIPPNDSRSLSVASALENFGQPGTRVVDGEVQTVAAVSMPPALARAVVARSKLPNTDISARVAERAELDLLIGDKDALQKKFAEMKDPKNTVSLFDGMSIYAGVPRQKAVDKAAADLTAAFGVKGMVKRGVDATSRAFLGANLSGNAANRGGFVAQRIFVDGLQAAMQALTGRENVKLQDLLKSVTPGNVLVTNSAQNFYDKAEVYAGSLASAMAQIERSLEEPNLAAKDVHARLITLNELYASYNGILALNDALAVQNNLKRN